MPLPNTKRAAADRHTEPSLQADLDYHQRTLQTDIHRDIDLGGPGLDL